MNSASHLDSNIPVLTEIISVADTSSANAVHTTDQQAAAQQSTPQQTTQTTQTMMSEQELEQLEKTIRENVLRQLLTRVDFVLEHRVRDGLADVLQTAVERLANEIRQGLAVSLEEVIHRTVSQEISKIQSAHPKN